MATERHAKLMEDINHSYKDNNLGCQLLTHHLFDLVPKILYGEIMNG